jgi:hypothetical protein
MAAVLLYLLVNILISIPYHMWTELQESEKEVKAFAPLRSRGDKTTT